MRHLLVVDDAPDICETLRVGLEDNGAWRVSTASGAHAALAVVLQDPPDAAVIDAVLPQIPGLVLARAVLDAGIPVLVISGEPGHQLRLTGAGCRFLAKPFTISRLAAEMTALLDATHERMAELGTGLDRLLAVRDELAEITQKSRHLVAEVARLRAELAKIAAPILVAAESKMGTGGV
jgi:DNA-binding response OmpR family regulator